MPRYTEVSHGSIVGEAIRNIEVAQAILYLEDDWGAWKVHIEKAQEDLDDIIIRLLSLLTTLSETTHTPKHPKTLDAPSEQPAERSP